MPDLDAFLHYRIVDVSSIKELSRRWYPRTYFNSPTKRGNHRALADIQESIEELRYYREAVFVPPPGPTSAEARELAARHGGALTGLTGETRAATSPPTPRSRGPRPAPENPGENPPDEQVHSSPLLVTGGSSPGDHVDMVGVAQLVERRVVVADVAGSSPVIHPEKSPRSAAEPADLGLVRSPGSRAPHGLLDQLRDGTAAGPDVAELARTLVT